MPDREHEDRFRGFEMAIERHMSRAAARKDELSQPVGDRPADEGVLFEGREPAHDQRHRVRGSHRIGLDEEGREPVEIVEGLRGIAKRCQGD